jgi:hypothetical protein
MLPNAITITGIAAQPDVIQRGSYGAAATQALVADGATVQA